MPLKDIAFQHEVLGPYSRLHIRILENVVVEPDGNDVLVLALEAATAAYHFLEKNGKFKQLNTSSDITLKKKISDVVDTRKHGLLRDGDRTCAFHA